MLGVSGFNLQGWNIGGKVSWKLLKGMYSSDEHFLDCCGPLINCQSSEEVEFDHFASNLVAFTEERVSGFTEVLIPPGQTATRRASTFLICSLNYLWAIRGQLKGELDLLGEARAGEGCKGEGVAEHRS